MRILIAAALAVPFLLVWLLSPEWAGHLAAIASVHVSATIITIWLSLNPKIEFLYPYGKISRLGSPAVKKAARIVFRGVTLLFGLGLLVITIPILKDTFNVLIKKSAEVIVIRGRVLGNSYPLGLYFIHQSPLLETPGEESGQIYSLFFDPARIERGLIYEFVLAPQSRLVLSAKVKQPGKAKGRKQKGSVL